MSDTFITFETHSLSLGSPSHSPETVPIFAGWEQADDLSSIPLDRNPTTHIPLLGSLFAMFYFALRTVGFHSFYCWKQSALVRIAFLSARIIN
ncbi:hypothetical protein BC835DRAFT_1413199 [Cytidiella melzeri]|nr:hypothetical protein BC835DRAFT_1413199 [Cytidiella melzeri]